MTASKVDGCDPNSDGEGGGMIQGGGGPVEQNPFLQDQTQCIIPTPDCNTFLLKQGELT